MIDRQKIIKIFKASPTPTSIVLADDPEFTFVQVNDAYCKMTQRSEEELIGNSLFESFPPNPEEENPTGIERVISSFRKVIKTGQKHEMNTTRYDIVLDDENYKERYFKIVNTPVFDEEGNVEFIVNSATDVTKQALNERHHDLMLNNAEDSFVLIDHDKKILSFNEAYAEKAEDIFGESPKVGLPIMNLALPERVDKVNKILDRVFSGEIIRADLSMTNQDGKERFFYTTYRPAYNDSGNIYGALFSVYEKTEEYNAKRALEENEAHYRTLIENGSDVIFVLSPEGEPTYISPSIKNVLGYTQDEAYKMDLMVVVHPDDTSIIQTELAKCLEKPGEPMKVTPARMMHKDGDYRWCEGTITNMLHDPSIKGIVDNFRDITDRVNYQEAIEETKEKYQSLIQTMDGIIWEADAQTFIFNYVSPQSKYILGYEPEEWIGKEGFWKNLIHPDDRDEAVDYCHYQTQKGINHTFEYRIKHKSGHYIWLRDIVTVVSVDGSPRSLRGLMIDITEQKELEQKLEQAYDMAQIGAWELDLIKQKLSWSGFVKELHEVDPDFEPDLDTAIEFYKEGWSRTEIQHAVEKAIEEGTPYDVELIIITAKGNEKWIRAVGKPDMQDGTCVRLFGSTQDITERKQTELQLKRSNTSLVERVKEQRCLYEITNLEEQELSITELLEKAIKIIPGGWKEPEFTGVQITWNEKQFSSSGYKKSDLFLHENIKRTAAGTIEITVAYLNDEKPETNPFLKEEKDLLKAIIEQVSLKVEQILQKNELDDQRYRMQQILDQSADIICTTKDGKFASINAACKRILGYTPEELIGRSFAEFIVNDDQEVTLELSEAIYNNDVLNFENNFIHKRGHEVPIIWSARWDEKENQIYATGRDATEIKAIEKEKEFERLNKEALINSTEDLVWSIDRELKLITANDSFIKGIKEQVGIDIKPGDHVMKGVDEDLQYRKTWQEYYERALSGESFRVETHEPSDNPSEVDIWYETSLNPIYEGKNITGVACFARDISGTIKAQKQIRLAEEKFRNVVEHSTNMFYQHDLNGLLTYVSPQSNEFLGYPPEEAKVKWTQFMTSHPINKEGEKLTQKAIDTGEVQKPYELQLQTADNRIIWVKVNEAPLIKDDRVVGIVGSLSEITERKKYEKQLKQNLERYNYVSKVSRDAIYDWDLINDKIHWGEGFRTLFGHKPGLDNYPIKNWARLVHSDDIEEIQRDLEFTLEDTSMNSWSSEYRFKMAKGGYAYVVEKAYIIRNNDGEAIRMIGALRDITESKEVDLQNEIHREIADYFKVQDRLKPILNRVLSYLTKYGKFETAEIWLMNEDKTHQNMIIGYAEHKTGEIFYDHSSDIKNFKNGQGLPGAVWKSKEIEVWDNIASKKTSVRREAAKKAGLRSAFGIPLFHNNEFIGVLLLSSEVEASLRREVLTLFEGLQNFLGSEIKRKQQEEEFHLLFESAPEIMAIAHPKGHFVKVNPSFCELLGYTEEEITSRPFEDFVYTDDLKRTKDEFSDTITGEKHSQNYINRYVTRNGDLVWISWYSSDVFGEDGFVFAYGRDVTETKELEQLLQLTNKLAKVGSWELKTSEENKNDRVYWSGMAREIFEVEDDYDPNLSEDLDFFLPESREILENAVANAIGRDESYDLELQIKSAKGTQKWVRVIGSAEFVNGKCQRIFGSIQDITEKKKAEINLEKAFEEKNEILESIKDAFFAVDESWTVTYWNKEAEQVLSKPREEIIGKNLWDEYEDAKDLKFYSEYHKAIAEQVTVNFEEFYPAVDKWFEVTGYPSDNGLSVYFKDVTTRKEAGLKLKEAYKEKAEILESIDDGFFTLNKNWTVTYWNKAAERLLHTPKQNIVGQNLWDIFSDAVDLPSYTNYHRTMYEGINVDFEDYYESLNKWFSISSYSTPDGISVFFKDITEQKVAQKKLEELNDELKQRADELATSNAELEQFAYVASHDLQEPLRMVTSFLTQLEKKYKDQLDEKAASYIHYAVDGAQRMRQIILDLLNYSRLNQDKANREEADLNKLFEDARSLERSHIKENEAEITVDSLPLLNVNPGAIQQVFQNLLSNAIKYHAPGSKPKIHVSAKEIDSHWRFSVKDNGIGINKEFQQNIFQLFQRLHTRDNYSGTGIGLAISKKIIERHGGIIWVESEEGKGSTFFFTIPKNQKRD
ncbi:MAG: PAS domain S-box protein [Gracilimonas sp.]